MCATFLYITETSLASQTTQSSLKLLLALQCTNRSINKVSFGRYSLTVNGELWNVSPQKLQAKDLEESKLFITKPGY